MEGSREGNIQQNVSSNKVERKVMEKNRRTQMKLLYSKLNSLLPTHHSNELPLTVSDQIDEAINYIKSLETKLKKDKEKKESFLRRSKRSLSLSPSSSSSAPASMRSQNSTLPELKIKQMGSAVEVVLTSGLEDQFLFYEIIRILREERAEIINVSYSVLENTVLYSLHAEIEDVVYEFGATTKLRERLERLVYKWKVDAETTQAAAASSSGHGGSHPPAADTPATSSDHHFWRH